VEGHRERGRRGLDVQVQAAGEGMDVGQVKGPGGGDPLLQPGGVARVRDQEGNEVTGQDCQGGHLGAGRLDPGERLRLAAGEAVRSGEQEPGGPAGRQVRAVAVEPALVDVADQEVGAALVAALPDLAQELLDRGSRLLGAALAEVVAVRVDEGGAVLRDALQPLGLAGPVVTFDRVQRDIQSAGALQQPDALAPQVVDLLPAFPAVSARLPSCIGVPLAQ
jgi:hypothetical protein